MPTYEYECEDCGKQFTVDQSMQEHVDQKTPRCPKCNKSKPVKQLISSEHVQTSKKS